MKRNFLLLFGFVVSFFLFSISEFGQATAGAPNPLTVELLSAHSQTSADTFFNNYGYGIETSGDVAHLYWQESGNGTEGTDLFYRQLPGGSTVRLTDPAKSEGDVSMVWFDTAVAPDGTFHIIWLEDTSTAEGGDLFYWSAATGTLLLSDHSQTEGYVQPAFNTLQLILDNSGNPHTYWYEETGTAEGEDLFYWSPLEGTVLLTNRSLTEGNDVDFGPNFLLTDDNGNAHITWGEFGNDGGTPTYFYWNSSLLSPIILPDIENIVVADNIAHIVWLAGWEGPINYWNSDTKSVQTLPSSTDDPGGAVTLRSWFKDSNNVANLFFVKENAGVCLAKWDTNSQSTTTLATGGDCYPPFSIYKDDSDIFHTVLVDQFSGQRRYRYWNSDLSQPIGILETAVPINFGTLTGLSGSSEVHFTWTITDGINENYYNWNNVSQTTTNLSQLSGNNTRIASMGRFVQPSDSKLFVLWSEQLVENGAYENFFWRSDTNTPVNLFTQLDISSVSTSFEPMKLAFLENGAPYTTWYGMLNGEPEGIYVWDSSKGIVHLAGESLPCSEIGRSYRSEADHLGNIYLTWQDDVSRTSYFWSQTSGQVDLSQTPAAETSCAPPLVAVSDNGRVFAMWVEESDVAGEGLDVYGGWIESSGRSVYLPMVTR